MAFSKVNRVRHLFDKSVLLIILNSLVFSTLFYCSTVWCGTTRRNVSKLQQVQNFAARIITGLRKYDHISPALKDLGWPSVKDLFIHRDLITMYKCLNGLVPNYLSRNIIRRFDIHGISTRHSNGINLSKCITSLAQRSFFYRAAKRWNELDSDIRNSTSLSLFKKAVKNLRFL